MAMAGEAHARGPSHHRREDVSRRDVIDAWARNLDYEKVLPLVAEVGNNIVGDAEPVSVLF